jgi:PPK2 family polyphosphate:nucleotide phosphotransferase
MPHAHTVKLGTKLSLSKLDPARDDGLTKEEAKEKTNHLAKEIEELQELMYAANSTALLCVFQGADTSGKDGAINKVLEYVNVQSCRVASFKIPTAEELAHDFLWRIHKQTPALGGVTVFNRSHYEDVLVVRVHSLAPKHVWEKRYEQINEFEQALAESGTVILKFFLHISKKEQEQRLLAREKDPIKAWKLSVNDWKERERWGDYTAAYEDALSKCSTPWAPWHVVPSDHKWFRDLCVAESIAHALRPFREQWASRLETIGSKARAELAAYRKSGGS